ncbi:unnamed protein product, partial [Prorocentrum cordatum]
MGQAPAGAGSAAGIAADELASGLPQELDWEKLITHVFRPEHRPVLLLTSRQQLPAAAGSGSRPSSAIDAFRIAEPPADSRAACTGVREAFSPDALGGRVGLVSQKGKKSLPNQDTAFYLSFVDADGSEVWLACVMDGHGPLGHDMSR